MRKPKRSKLGVILDEKGLSYQDFAELVFQKTGYFIHPQNICNFSTGLRDIKTIKVATFLSYTLGVELTDII
jgi:hypothetical protein